MDRHLGGRRARLPGRAPALPALRRAGRPGGALKRPRLLRVEAAPAEFAPLLRDLSERGLRVGWLDLRDGEPPALLAEAAAAGAPKAVAAGPRRTLALKTLRGAPVLDDLLREHFLGFHLVLVRGPLEAPLLEPDGDAWRLTDGERSRRIDAERLAVRIRRH